MPDNIAFPRFKNGQTQVSTFFLFIITQMEKLGNIPYYNVDVLAKAYSMFVVSRRSKIAVMLKK